jgi:Spy/CpxP family protein refolding chaperone
MRTTLTALALLLICGLATPDALARQGERRGPGGPHGMRAQYLRGALFPPEMVMSHAPDLGLSDEQRKAIIQDIQETQASVVPLEWELREESRKLGDLLEASQVDEEAALAQAEALALLEGRMKRTHLGLLIRIKNRLTEEQQETLSALARERRRDRKGFGGRPGGSGGPGGLDVPGGPGGDDEPY